MNTGPRIKKISGPDLSLTPDQHSLLLTALSSNRSPAMPNSNSNPSAQNATRPPTGRADSKPTQGRRSLEATMTGTDLFKSPVQQSPQSGVIGSGSFEDSPFLDYELEDGSFDWDNNGDLMIGSLPGVAHEEEGDLHDKRKSPEDEEDEEEPGHKRREGEDKTAKKPGRKPLTGEPTTVSLSAFTLILMVGGLILTPPVERNVKLRIEPHNEHFASGKNVILKSLKLKSMNWKKLPSQLIMRTEGFVPKSIV